MFIYIYIYARIVPRWQLASSHFLRSTSKYFPRRIYAPITLVFLSFYRLLFLFSVVAGSGITMRLGEGVKNGEACAGMVLGSGLVWRGDLENYRTNFFVNVAISSLQAIPKFARMLNSLIIFRLRRFGIISKIENSKYLIDPSVSYLNVCMTNQK